MVDTDDTRRTTDDGRRTTDDGRRTTPRVWHKLPTGELKIGQKVINRILKYDSVSLAVHFLFIIMGFSFDAFMVFQKSHKFPFKMASFAPTPDIYFLKYPVFLFTSSADV